MADPRLSEARALKKRATALRNRGEFGRALSTLDDAIRLLDVQRSDVQPTVADAREVRAELADTYGMKGGVFRRVGNLDAALDAYKTGAGVEDGENLSTTYNRSNVVTLSITAKGLSPTEPELRRTIAGIIGHLEVETAGPRSDEWWAWSDLAQFYLLNGEWEKARTSYASARSKTGATAEEVKRHATILGELADHTATNAPQISASIRAAIGELS